MTICKTVVGQQESRTRILSDKILTQKQDADNQRCKREEKQPPLVANKDADKEVYEMNWRSFDGGYRNTREANRG